MASKIASKGKCKRAAGGLAQPPAPDAASPMTPEEFVALANRAQAGDESAMPALRERLKEPSLVNSMGGDLAKQAQHLLIANYAGKNYLVREALERKAQLIRVELVGPKPAPIERLLAERIVTTWLYVNVLDVNYASQVSMSLALGIYYQRSMALADRRHLAAIKALAVVRKLALPVLLQQINVAAQPQVNPAAPPAAAGPRTTPAAAPAGVNGKNGAHSGCKPSRRSTRATTGRGVPRRTHCTQ